MAFLHCHNCDWLQDDFWDESYNPIRHLLVWERDLLNRNLDEPFTDDGQYIKDHGNLTLREVIARQLERAAGDIRKMLFRTELDFGPDNKYPCPKCGEVAWDID